MLPDFLHHEFAIVSLGRMLVEYTSRKKQEIMMITSWVRLVWIRVIDNFLKYGHGWFPIVDNKSKNDDMNSSTLPTFSEKLYKAPSVKFFNFLKYSIFIKFPKLSKIEKYFPRIIFVLNMRSPSPDFETPLNTTERKSWFLCKSAEKRLLLYTAFIFCSIQFSVYPIVKIGVFHKMSSSDCTSFWEEELDLWLEEAAEFEKN